VSDPVLAEIGTLLLTSATRYRLYGVDHRLTAEALDQLMAAVEPVLASERELRIVVSGEEMLTEGARADATAGSTAALVRRLTEKGVGLIELHRGLRRSELETFCAQLADLKAGSVTSQTHLLVGAAEAKGASAAMAEALRIQEAMGVRDDPVTEEAMGVMRLTQHLRDHHEVRVRDAREIVLGLLSHLACEENLFSSLAEIREHSLFTYLHTCNVATLAMSFGMALGMPSEATFDLGAAALLHDLGKTFVPRDILDKPGKLDEAEWSVVRQHPAVGARLLMRQQDATHLSVVVAYEHHMHYAGGGGYPKAPFAPSVPSQMVAIIDSFDAIFGKRSYHRQVDVLHALEALQAERGRMYNPELVDEFSRFVTTQLDALTRDGAAAAS
jgi:HD-GYP domain-containing protein (c-di-GMP phosphodiesterase class II)